MLISDADLSLPSQKDLLLRVNHLATFGEQLVVVFGEKGSGKTTLATQLLNGLTEQNIALVSCPKHCDDAEIRRKIFIQLLAEPIFDDEVPLISSLLQAVDFLPARSYIILDDSQHLSLALWAECLALSHFRHQGKTVQVLMTCSEHFLSEILGTLEGEQSDLVVPIKIPVLTLEERGSLYAHLSQQSDKPNVVEKDQLSNLLALQSGRPIEIAALFSPQELQSQKSSVPPSRYKKIGALFFVSILALTGIYSLISGFTPDKAKRLPPISSEMLAGPIVPRSDGLSEQNHLSSAPPLEAKQTSDELLAEPPIAETPTLSITASQSQIKDEQSVMVEQAAGADDISIGDTSIAIDNEMAAINTEVGTAKQAGMKSQASIVEKSLVKPGYTLQLASLKNSKTVHLMLKAFAGLEGVQLAKYKGSWIILAGDYSTKEAATLAAKQLRTEINSIKPWIRQWKDLSKYQIQPLPNREIEE